MPDWNDLKDRVDDFFLSGLLAYLGGMVAYIMRVQSGATTHKWLQLVILLPVAFFMGIVGQGLTDFLNLHSTASSGMIAALGYIGPRSVEIVFDMVRNQKGKE
ncbi:LydA-like holin [uncultured Caudovirales phage]|uniref:LydA-like holin n=1 Tax=uncultured Caudovirales phage TaxID=2100421 RepID=A0A6J5M7H5_9CAUD|nr:LydA-like holin [uncultured Caudovirales phage]